MRGKGFVKLHRALSLICRPEGATAEELAGELGVDRRSAYRILDTLELIGVPIFDEREEFGKTVRKKVDETYRRKFINTSLPALNLTLSEIIALYSLRGSERLYEGTEIEKEIGTAFSKIDSLLPGNLAGQLDRIRMLFVSSAKFAKDYSGKEEILDTLTDAILRRRTCTLRYHGFHQDKISEFEADPLHFFDRDGGIYLIYHSPKHRNIRTLAVERILEISETDASFLYPKDFQPDKYLDAAFNIIQGEPMTVKVLFSPGKAKYIKERAWSKTQRITDHMDGSVTLEMETSGEWEIKRWVLGYGPEAKILAPPELQDSIAEDIRKMQSLYGGSTPA